MRTITVEGDNEQNAALLEKMLKAKSVVDTVNINQSFVLEEPS